MIILDIETTGLDPKRHCMLSLGAVDYDSGLEFYGECDTCINTEFDPIAMEINGFSAASYGLSLKAHLPAAHMLYWQFREWAQTLLARKDQMLLAGHNIGHLDILFLEHYHQRFAPEPWLFGYRTLDLHSVAYAVLGRSLSHAGICEALSLPTEPKPHHALHGARSERDAFKRLFELQAELREGAAAWEHNVKGHEQHE